MQTDCSTSDMANQGLLEVAGAPDLLVVIDRKVIETKGLGLTGHAVAHIFKDAVQLLAKRINCVGAIDSTRGIEVGILLH